MSHGITYCPAFQEDAVYGVVKNSFQFRWTCSCIANPEHEPEDMLKAVLHAFASSESSETTFLAVLDRPLASSCILVKLACNYTMMSVKMDIGMVIGSV